MHQFVTIQTDDGGSEELNCIIWYYMVNILWYTKIVIIDNVSRNPLTLKFIQRTKNPKSDNVLSDLQTNILASCHYLVHITSMEIIFIHQ